MQEKVDLKIDFAFSDFFSYKTVFLSLFLLRKVRLKLDCELNAYFVYPETTEQIEQNLATKAFFELLKKICIVFLQVDNVVFMR